MILEFTVSGPYNFQIDLIILHNFEFQWTVWKNLERVSLSLIYYDGGSSIILSRFKTVYFLIEISKLIIQQNVTRHFVSLWVLLWHQCLFPVLMFINSVTISTSTAIPVTDRQKFKPWTKLHQGLNRIDITSHINLTWPWLSPSCLTTCPLC